MAKYTRRKNTRRKKGGKYQHPMIANKFPKKFPQKKTQKKAASCHPSTMGTPKVAPESCLTSEKLQKVKNAYNLKHPNHHVLGTTDSEIYQEIANRFADSCKEEKCWIRKLLGDNDIKPIYRPTSPADWKKNPVEWLSNFDIEAVMNQYEETYPEFEFLGPVPIDFDKRSKKGDDNTCVSKDVCAFHLDEKIKQGKTKMGIVFNLSPSTSSGSHWVSLYMHLPDAVGGRKPAAAVVVERGGGKLAEEIGDGDWNDETPYCFFFDSAGGKVPKEIEELVARFQTEWAEYVAAVSGGAGMRGLSPKMFYDSNVRTKTEHQRGNTECGVYSIFFITTMLTGKCAGGGVESDSCALSLDTEQKKVDYFQGEKDGGEKIRIPDSFMEELRPVFFTPHA